jgi:hypothetical protein
MKPQSRGWNVVQAPLGKRLRAAIAHLTGVRCVCQKYLRKFVGPEISSTEDKEERKVRDLRFSFF